jgi:hypothetical protein
MNRITGGWSAVDCSWKAGWIERLDGLDERLVG